MGEAEDKARGREMARKVFEMALAESKSIGLSIVQHGDGTHTVEIQIATKAKIEQQTIDDLVAASM